MGALQQRLSDPTQQSAKVSQKPLRQVLGVEYLIREDVLTLVSQNKCKDASEMLKKYLEKDFDLPLFKNDIKMYVNHAIDIVSAIDMGRNYPNMQSLSWSKQQEIKEKAKKHSDELSQILEKIERVYLRHRQIDQRTTVYFIKSVWISVLLVVGTLLTIDLLRGRLLDHFYVFANVVLDKLSAFISSFI